MLHVSGRKGSERKRGPAWKERGRLPRCFREQQNVCECQGDSRWAGAVRRLHILRILLLSWGLALPILQLPISSASQTSSCKAPARAQAQLGCTQEVQGLGWRLKALSPLFPSEEPPPPPRSFQKCRPSPHQAWVSPCAWHAHPDTRPTPSPSPHPTHGRAPTPLLPTQGAAGAAGAAAECKGPPRETPSFPLPDPPPSRSPKPHSAGERNTLRGC